jgi:hypothetical protein
MLFKVTSTYHRPSEDVKWHGSFVLDQEVEDQMAVFLVTNYLGKRKLEHEAPDINTLVVHSYWESEEAYNTYRNEPSVKAYFDLVDKYFEVVGITSDPKITSLVEGSF